MGHESTNSVRYALLGRRRFLSGTAALAIGAVAAQRLDTDARTTARRVAGTPTPNSLADVRCSTSGWRPDSSRHAAPLTEISPGGPPRDGIPPIDTPAYVTIAEADGWLEATEPVIAVAEAVAGQAGQVAARAYP